MATTNPLNASILKLKTQYNQEELPEFELMRKRLAEQMREQEQTQREGLQRSFARFGGGPAGAQIKAQQQLESELGKQRLAGEESVASQELSMRRQLAEAEKQRQFASAEREAGQIFARGEREAQQVFSRGERESSQDFTKRMADLDMAFKDKVFNFEKDSKLKELDMAERQFALDKDIAEFNKQIATLEANKPTDLMGSLFGPAFSTSQGPVGGLVGAISKPVAPIVNTIGGAISKFCFAEGTPVKMSDGTEKLIEDINLCDELLFGGMVYFFGSTFTDSIYKYHDIYVTGSHAVFEDGKFIRVEDSPIAEKVYDEGPFRIYFLSNMEHLIAIGDTLFSDYHESDNFELSDEDCLKELNEKIKNNKEVQSWPCK